LNHQITGAVSDAVKWQALCKNRITRPYLFRILLIREASSHGKQCRIAEATIDVNGVKSVHLQVLDVLGIQELMVAVEVTDETVH